jgi:hypothetical protein
MDEEFKRIHERGREALAALSGLPDSKPMDEMKARLEEAIATLVEMRDDLIQLQRSGKSCGDLLWRTNGILSTIYGTEFPVGGLSEKRISEARKDLRQLFDA